MGFLAKVLGTTVDELIDLAARDGNRLTSILLEWAKKERVRISGNRIRGILPGFKMVLSFYGLEGNVVWTKIRMAVPPAKKATKDRAPKREETLDLLNVCNLHRFAVTAMCSGGFRVGSCDYFSLGDILYVEINGVRFGRVVIYRDEPEEYVTFVSPECMKFYEKYLVPLQDLDPTFPAQTGPILT